LGQTQGKFRRRKEAFVQAERAHIDEWLQASVRLQQALQPQVRKRHFGTICN
jgi:hypothetical protein